MNLGKELTGPELKAWTPVLVDWKRDGMFPVLMSISTIDLVGHRVRLYSRELGLLLVVRYDQHGAFYDPDGHTIHIYEAL